MFTYEDRFYLCNYDELLDAKGSSEEIKKLWTNDWTSLLNTDLSHIILKSDITDKEIITIIKESKNYSLKDALILAIANLLTFCERNWNTKSCSLEIENIFGVLWPSHINASKRLQRDSEDIDINIKNPEFLLMSHEILSAICSIESSLISQWWLFRSKLIHQKILEDTSATIFSQLEICIAKLLNMLPTLQEHPRLQALLLAELSQAYILYGRVQKVEEYLNRAKCLLGLKFQLKGALGKRTKFQETDLPQLTLYSELDGAMKCPSADETHGTTVLPKQIELTDDVRLNKIKFVDEFTWTNLPSLEQTICLLTVQYLQKSQPKDSMADEELMPFIDTILNQKHSAWSTYIMTLLIKCKLEAGHKRTVERAMMQCEAIVNSNPGDAWSQNKLSHLWSSGLTPCCKWRQQLADLYLSLGLVKAALEIYLDLQQWEDVIVCYTVLQLRHKSAEVIKQQLVICETPKLYCLLGDATDDPTCYEKAWELSNYKSSRAQRHWGNYLFNKRMYSECIPHYQTSLEINSLQENVWFRLAYASLETEDWETSATAYRRYTYLQPNSFEAWNNLAKVYVKQGDKRRAHRALIEALRFNYDNWKLWENVIAVSMDTGHFEDVLRGIHRILDIQSKYQDVEVLRLLVNAVVTGKPDADGNNSGRLLKRVSELMGRITSVHMNNPIYWSMYADLTTKHLLKAQRLQKAYQGFTQSGEWSKDSEKSFEIIKLSIRLIEHSLQAKKEASGSEQLQVDQQLSSARLTAQGVIRIMEKDCPEQCKVELNTLKNQFNDLMSYLQSIM